MHLVPISDEAFVSSRKAGLCYILYKNNFLSSFPISGKLLIFNEIKIQGHGDT